MIGLFKRNKEFIIIAIISALILILLISKSSIIIDKFSNSIVNQQILNFSGTLFGLLLTAYAILFGLLPTIAHTRKDFLKTNAMEKLNKTFIAAIILSIFIVIIGFTYYFISGNIKKILIFVQIEVLTILLLISILLLYTLYLLFRSIKNELIS